MTTERNDIFPPPSYLPIDNLADTADLLDTKALAAGAKEATVPKPRPAITPTTTKGKAPIRTQAKHAPKRRTPETEPSMTLQAAMASGASAATITDLRQRWMRYNQQEARAAAKAENEVLNKAILDGRRQMAEQLLVIADIYDITLDMAKKIFQDALAAKFPTRGK